MSFQSIIGKSTMAFLTGQSWHILKSWYTGAVSQMDLTRSLVSSVVQAAHKCD